MTTPVSDAAFADELQTADPPNLRYDPLSIVFLAGYREPHFILNPHSVYKWMYHRARGTQNRHAAQNGQEQQRGCGSDP